MLLSALIQIPILYYYWWIPTCITLYILLCFTKSFVQSFKITTDRGKGRAKGHGEHMHSIVYAHAVPLYVNTCMYV